MLRVPEFRRDGSVRQELVFSLICITMAMISGHGKSQAETASWIKANYTDLKGIYFAFFSKCPVSEAPISQPTISRILFGVSTYHLDEILCLLGQGDFQKYWKEYARHRVKLAEINQNRLETNYLLKLFQILTEKAIRVIAVDGKARKGVTDKSGRTEIDVTFYDVLTGQVLYRVTIPEKKGESTVFTEIIESGKFQEIISFIENASIVVTADAGITSQKITGLLTVAGISYCLAIKGNAGNAFDTVKNILWDDLEDNTTEESGHGREEKRTVKTLDLDTMKRIKWMQFIDPSGYLQAYSQLKKIVRITSTVKEKGKTVVFHRYFILGGEDSKSFGAEEIHAIIRGHWQIESNHWIKDVVLNEDDCPTKTPDSSRVLAVFRDILLGVIKIFSKSPTQFIRELNNNIKDLWPDIRKGLSDCKNNEAACACGMI